MTEQAPIGANEPNLVEARPQNLRRQIAIVSALILALSATLAVVSLFPRLPPSVVEPAPAIAMRETTPAAGVTSPTPASAPVAATAPAAADEAAAPVAAAAASPPLLAPASPALPLPAPAPVPAPSAGAPTATDTASATTAAKSPGQRSPRLSLSVDDSASGRRHYVQLGIFMQPSNAEALRARLQEHGIPMVLETRVRVGPFASREEALAAQIRLRELGFDAGTVVPLKP